MSDPKTDAGWEQAKHTPTPWIAKEGRNYTFQILTSDKRLLIATVHETQMRLDEPEHRKHDANLICRAVNSHEALLEENSNLKHDYAIVSAERNNFRALIAECHKWIAGHAHLAGITANRKANEILAAIAAAEQS